MLEAIIQLAITPMILLMASKTMKGVHVKDTQAAILTTIAIFVVGFFASWILIFFLNVATLGLFWAVGLGVVIRIIANAIVIEVIDQFSEGFSTEGFLPSVWLSIILAITWGVVDYLF